MFETKQPIPDHLAPPAHAGGVTALAGDITPPSRIPTPLRGTPKRLRPYVSALRAFKHGRNFQAKPSKHHTRRNSMIAEKEGPFAPTLTVRRFKTTYKRCVRLTS